MTDIAKIGFSADTSDLSQAKATLDSLVPSASAAEKASAKVGAAMDRAAVGADHMAAATSRAAAANFSGAAGFDVLTGKANSTFAAINGNLGKVGLLDKSVQGVGKSFKFSGTEALNFSRQIADVGITAAMGMNPLMIAIQQGPQLFDILQTAATRSGMGIMAVFRAAGAVIWASIAPLLPMLALIAGAIGLVTGAFALGAREINKGNDDILSGLNLTEKQLERVKKSGVDTAVTMGDTFSAFFQIVGERIYGTFEPAFKWLSQAWSDIMDFLTKYGGIAIASILGAFVGSYRAIVAVWSMLPDAIADYVYQAAAFVVDGTESMINGVIDGLNWLDKATGMDAGGGLGHVELGTVTNMAKGSAHKAGQSLSKAFWEGFGEGREILNDTFKRARQIREKAIVEAAGKGDDPKTTSAPKGGKTQGELFGDLVGDVARDIAMLEAKTKAVGMAADAALLLTNQQDLLNKAAEKGISLTTDQSRVLMVLANDLTNAQIELRNAENMDASTKSFDKQIKTLSDGAAQIGVYGEALAFIKYQQALVNEATEKGIPLTTDYLALLDKRAAKLAAGESGNIAKQANADREKQHKLDMWMLGREIGAIDLKGGALIGYNRATDMMLQLKQKEIDLSPELQAAIEEEANEYGYYAEAIDEMREKAAFAKDVIRGFFKDFYENIKEGQSVWEAFGNTVLGVLDKILNRMMDKTLDKIVDIAMNALMSADGNVFGSNGVTGFATGGTFTNGIVNSPTMFGMPNGGLGVMGEAGPEAVLPLERGPDGALGVQMFGGTGGGRGGGTPSAPTINIENHYTLTGAVSSNDIIELNKRVAEQTKADMKREIPGIIEQFQRDGAIS